MEKYTLFSFRHHFISSKIVFNQIKVVEVIFRDLYLDYIYRILNLECLTIFIQKKKEDIYLISSLDLII